MAGTLGGRSVSAQFTAIRKGALKNYGPEVVTRLLEYSDSYAAKAKAKLQIEPSARPGQRYIRTGQLKSKWRIVRGSNGNAVTWALTNNAISSGLGAEASAAARAKANARRRRYYAAFVQGPEDKQAWMHKGRWTRIDQAVNREEYLRGAQLSINTSLRRMGLMT